MFSRISSLVVAGSFAFASSVTMAQPCENATAGVAQNVINLTTVALAKREPGVDGQPAKLHHIGNAVFIREQGDQLIFLTAHHVAYKACEMVDPATGSELVIQFAGNTRHYVSDGFTIPADRCNGIREIGYKRSVDLNFFNVPSNALPESSVGVANPLRPAPISDSWRDQNTNGYYFGYKPFPKSGGKPTTISSIQIPTAYSIPNTLSSGWSGAPVFKKSESDGRYYLAGIIITSPELSSVFKYLDENSGETSDKRIGVISYEIAKDLISSQSSVVVRLSSYEFDAYAEAPSVGAALLHKRLDEDADIKKEETREFQSNLEGLSSIEQFELTAHLLRLLRARDKRLKNKPNFLLAIFQSLSHWCYYSEPLETELLNTIRQAAAYNGTGTGMVMQLVASAQTGLKKYFLGKSEVAAANLFARADRTFSLLYPEGINTDIRNEFKSENFSKKVISNAVFDHARLKLVANENNSAFQNLAELSLRIDPGNVIAKISLADNYSKTGKDYVRAIKLYTDFFEDKNAMAQNPNKFDRYIGHIQKSLEYTRQLHGS